VSAVAFGVLPSALSQQPMGGIMAGFVQIMELQTSRIDELKALTDKMREDIGDVMTTSRATMTADRDRPGHYTIIIEFDSYEQAMAQSNNPRLGAYAAQRDELLDGPPVFHNLDVLEVV
jgi:quinol monooxygenase YgiN